VTEEFGALYRAAKPYLDTARVEFTKRVEEISGGVADRYVTGRVKTPRSLIRKLRERERTWDSITDKVGLRVICTSRADCRVVEELLCAGPWDVVSREVVKGKFNELYYQGIHLEISAADVLDDRGVPIVCEVQIRTRAQDAWSVASHKLAYKGPVKPPKKMRRLIDRLTILVEVFDDEVVRLFKRRRKLPMYREAVVLEHLDAMYHHLTGEVAEQTKDVAIASQLVGAYAADEIATIEQLVDAFCAAHPDLSDLIEQHAPTAEGYNDSADWLFTQPEILMVLERASTRPHMLLDTVHRTDLEGVVRSSCISAGLELPAAV